MLGSLTSELWLSTGLQTMVALTASQAALVWAAYDPSAATKATLLPAATPHCSSKCCDSRLHSAMPMLYATPAVWPLHLPSQQMPGHVGLACERGLALPAG